jgi:hypothetical protein
VLPRLRYFDSVNLATLASAPYLHGFSAKKAGKQHRGRASSVGRAQRKLPDLPDEARSVCSSHSESSNSRYPLGALSFEERTAEFERRLRSAIKTRRPRILTSDNGQNEDDTTSSNEAGSQVYKMHSPENLSSIEGVGRDDEDEQEMRAVEGAIHSLEHRRSLKKRPSFRNEAPSPVLPIKSLQRRNSFNADASNANARAASVSGDSYYLQPEHRGGGTNESRSHGVHVQDPLNASGPLGIEARPSRARSSSAPPVVREWSEQRISQEVPHTGPISSRKLLVSGGSQVFDPVHITSVIRPDSKLLDSTEGLVRRNMVLNVAPRSKRFPLLNQVRLCYGLICPFFILITFLFHFVF